MILGFNKGKNYLIGFTSKRGREMFIVSNKFYKLNPYITYELKKDEDRAIDIRILGMFKIFNFNNSIELITDTGKSFIESDNITVFFEKEELRKKAEETLNYFNLMEKDMEDMLSIDLISPVAVFLIDKNLNYQIITKDFDVNFGICTNIFIDQCCVQFCHELVEITLLEKYNIYFYDRYTRWIGDGIASYTLGKAYQKYLPEEEFQKQYGDAMNILKKTKKEEYNLIDWEMVTKIKDTEEKRKLAYLLSMYFWQKMIDKAGEDIMARFLKEIEKIEKPKNEQLIPILSDLTGLNIEDELNVKVSDVINYAKEFFKKPTE